jgi:ubiquinone/menaquinone biosynthesis C-methylase UbiE
MVKAHDQISKDLFQEEYTEDFVNRWDELIDWKRRYEAEDGFFEKLLKQYDAQKILDAACGTGFHTVTLARSGFDVTASDGAATMLEKAKENADRFGLQGVDFVEADWTSLTESFQGEKFDAIVCLGNAFTHLFEEEDRIQALNEMHALLNDGGIAVIDHRNYDKILDKGFDSKHQFYYVGDVEVSPEEINDKYVRLRYSYADGSYYHLTLSCLRQDYMDGLLQNVGFEDVIKYGDFDPDFDTYDPDFIVQVAKK